MGKWKPNAAYIEKRKAEEKELEEKLVQGIEKVYSSEEWKNFLDMNENFRNFSVENKILVYLQCPEATMIRTANSWNKQFERQVNKGEHGIKIRQPVFKEYENIEKLRGTAEDDGHLEDREKDDQGRVKLLKPQMFYRYISEFDVSQTNGKELPPHQIMREIDEKMDDYETVKAAMIKAAPCPVSFANKEDDDVLRGGASGYYRRSEDRIVIQSGMSEVDTISVLAHEISHAMLHGEEMRVEGIETTDKIPGKSEKEVQAESSAYMICSHLGLKTDRSAFGYVANYAHKSDDPKENIRFLRKNLDTICKCANKIIDTLDIELSKEIPLAEERKGMLKDMAAAFLATEDKPELFDVDVEIKPAKSKEQIEKEEEAYRHFREEQERMKAEMEQAKAAEAKIPALITFDTLSVGDKLRTAQGAVVSIKEINADGVVVENANGGSMKIGNSWREMLKGVGTEIVQPGDKEYGRDEIEREVMEAER